MRVSQVPIGKSLSYSVLLGLGGAPIDSFDDSWYRKLTEFRVLQHARTYADINAIMDELRAVFPRLRTITPCGAVSPSNDPYQVSKTAAQNRLREQLDSGLLEWRLNDLREQTIALLRAEHEHHRYVHAVRRGQ